MKKILGLDIGIKTIGWSVIHEPEAINEKYRIAGMGVRVVQLSSDESDEFIKGSPITKNSLRVVMRSSRRNLQRYKLRRQQLIAVLTRLKMLPGEGLYQLTALELYRLRDKGVSGQLSLPELGRVLYHLNQRRGYKNNRKDSDAELQPIEMQSTEARNNKESFLGLIDDRERALRDKNITIGQDFYRQLTAQENGIGKLPVRIKDKLYLRGTYMAEFDRIWSTQQAFYPDVLTDQNRKKIRDEIIYYQRPDPSKQGLISQCLFEKNHKVSHKSSPLYQVARIWEELNNIALISLKAKGEQEEGFVNRRRKLTGAEKEKLFKVLKTKEKLSTGECLKVLGYNIKSAEFKLVIRYRGYVNGNATYAKLKKIFDLYEFDDYLLQFNIVSGRKVNFKTGELLDYLQTDPSFEKQPLFQLWHLVYSVKDPEVLINKLQNKFNIPVAMAKAISRIDFTEARFGNLSARALRNILPYLQDGHTYAQSCALAGYNFSEFVNTEDTATCQVSEKLKPYDKNSLRQPVIEKIFNQAVNLVNSILDETNGYISAQERMEGKFEIRLALARTLKQVAGERKRTYFDKLMHNRMNESIEAAIKEIFPNRVISRNDIIKYKLWKEFGNRSPYEPTIFISLTELLSSKYQITNIIPKTRLFDDSFHNKTICRRDLIAGVLGRHQMTIYDFMKTTGEQAFREYVEFIKLHLRPNNGISNAKFEKLMMPGEKIPGNFIHRQMQETSFISRKAKDLFSSICLTVVISSGDVTNYLRNLWGYDQAMLALNWSKYLALGKAIIEINKSGEPVKRILDWNKNDDHRYHAVDALVVAVTKRDYIQHLNKLNAEIEGGFQLSVNKGKEGIQVPAPFSFEELCKATAEILVSYKAGKRLVGRGVNRIKKGGIRKWLSDKPFHADYYIKRLFSDASGNWNRLVCPRGLTGSMMS